MIQIQKSGYYYPNCLMRSFLLALEDLTGKNGVSALLNIAGLSAWSASYPPDDLEKSIDFAEISTIQWALEEVYGPRGGRNLARRAAQTALSHFVDKLGLPAPGGAASSVESPVGIPLHALEELAEILATHCDQVTTVSMDGDLILLQTTPCPFCWGRKTDVACCHGVIGFIEQSLQAVTPQQSHLLKEIRCVGTGDEHCEFSIQSQS